MQKNSKQLEKKCKIGIVVFPGSNCDRDVHSVLNNVLKVDADLVWHTSDNILQYDAVVIPGGFSYGDRLRAGIIAAHSPIVGKIKQMAKDGVPILGICNGFQVLVESCLLPGALMMNDSLNFVCRWTTLRVDNNKTPFTNCFSQHETFQIPVAHGQGRYIADKKTLKDLEKKNQVVLRYSDDDPNGSSHLIAAICNPQGNVMGLMPHPERASESIISLGRSTNKAILIFKSLISYLTNSNNILYHRKNKR
ncbi:MAG: phosphoribosylformylglycinamidine synthase subunit PurQ [Nitrososphaeraceae archaeon]